MSRKSKENVIKIENWVQWVEILPNTDAAVEILPNTDAAVGSFESYK